jgi:AraC-like DNA-binding protein
LEKHDSEVWDPRGAILRPEQAAKALALRRYPPRQLGAFVQHLWFIDWDLERPYVQSVLPLPAVNAVAEVDRFEASGVQTRRFDRRLVGRGSVYGVLFRPAGFRPFVGGSMRALTDGRLDMAARLGVDAGALFEALAGAADDAARCEHLEDLLASLAPRPHPLMGALNAVVEEARLDPGLTRAEDLASRAGVSLRTLQRRLREHVGVGPKALLKRLRLQEAAARLAEGEPLADLAYALGYCDQAHFARDFTEAVGHPPGRYAAMARG